MSGALENLLYYGDNLDILRRHVKDESVDLVYLDPPFKSNQDYNVLFAERDGTRAASQILAFEDTWRWDQTAARAYFDLVGLGGNLSNAMQAFRMILGESDMMAYLAMMAPRLVELRRVLKPTGSIYLHCDPTASHYLKLLMDAVFGPGYFKNEIIWKRTSAHSGSKRWGPVHDIILFYTRTEKFTWNTVFQPYSGEYITGFYRQEDQKGKYQVDNLTGAGIRHGESGQPWRDVNPTDVKRHWAVPNKIVTQLLGRECADLSIQEKLDLLDKEGLIYWPPQGKMPRLKRYLDAEAGVQIVDVITDISPIGAKAAERLGYPTQKPEALLERIINASSDKGQVVLDPFCGCGTSIAVAQQLGRHWIGIDITHIAITLVKARLLDAFGGRIRYRVLGEPVSLPDTEALAAADPWQFQWWALGLVGARPVEQKRGADKGIDGRRYFMDDASGKAKQVIFSVKAGKAGVAHVRDLAGVLAREKAAIGVLITMSEPSEPMRAEAASGGFYESPGWNRSYPRLQLRTIEELLGGMAVEVPPSNLTFKKAPKAKTGDDIVKEEMFGYVDSVGESSR